MSHYQDYQAAFDKKTADLEIPADCVAKPPVYRPGPGSLVDPKMWDFSWWLTFKDNCYIVCHEIWSHRAGKKPTRDYLSFHYGPIINVDDNGKIDRSSSNPLVLRICKSGKSCEPPHLHYKKPHPAPHYEQSKVEGLALEDVDMFQFVEAVFRARKEGIELDAAMGFKLR